METTMIMTIVITAVSTAITLIGLFLFYEESLDRFLLKWKGGLPEGFLIFITGTNGVGKTTIASRLARKLGITSVVEVTELRSALRSRLDLFEEAGKMEEYEQLISSSFMLDEFSEDYNNKENYDYQCEIMTKTIVYEAKRKQKQKHIHNIGTIFEGINIIPSKLIREGIPAQYVLFVNLKVEPSTLLKERLFNKTSDVEQQDRYAKYLKEILATSTYIDNDFNSIYCPHTEIHKMTLYNNKGKNKTVRAIAKEIRSICKTRRKKL